MDDIPVEQQSVAMLDAAEQIGQAPAAQFVNASAVAVEADTGRVEAGAREEDHGAGRWKPIDLDFTEPTTIAAGPFPLDLLPARLGRLIGDFSDQRRLQLDFVAGAVIGGFAIAIGNRARLMGFDGEAEPLAHIVTLVGQPNTGKSKAIEIAARPLGRIEQAMIDAYDAALAREKQTHSLSALASTLKETVARRLGLEGRSGLGGQQDEAAPPPGLILTEVTVAGLLDELKDSEDGRGVVNHELTSVFALGGGREAVKTRAILLQGFDGGVYRKRTATGGRLVVPALHLSILGATQPDRVKLVTGNARDGLVPRILWFAPDAQLRATMAVGTGDTQAYEEALTRVIRIEPARDAGGYSYRIALLDEARPLLEAASGRWIEAQRKADGVMQDVFGRARQQALRLATVLGLAENALAGIDKAIPAIGAEDVRRGIELMDRYFIGMAERAIGHAGAPPASDALRLALHLRRLGKATVSVRDDLYRGPGSPLRKADAVAAALEELRQRGFVRDASRSRSVGRPGLTIEVHPKLIDG